MATVTGTGASETIDKSDGITNGKYQLSSEDGGTLRLMGESATNTASDAHSGIIWRTCRLLTPQIFVRHNFATWRCRATVLHKTIMRISEGHVAGSTVRAIGDKR